MIEVEPSDVAAALPELSGDYSLMPDMVLRYRESGHVLLKSLAGTSEVAAFRESILHAVQERSKNVRPLEERDTYGKAFLQITNLWAQDAAVRRFVFARRFAKVAAELMGVDGVRIYHDQALFKEPGGGHTPWHQDQYYWPLDTDKTITLWMPLVDISAESGAMFFASGSHKEGYLGDLPISDKSEEELGNFVSGRGYKIDQLREMKAGDATFHSGWTLHGAPGNPTQRTREVMTIIYFADGAFVSEPDNQNRIDDLKSWLPGLSPKDLAASPLNPLVYKAGKF